MMRLKQAGSFFVGVFVRGLVVVLPIALTAAVLVWLVAATEAFLGDIFRGLFPSLGYWPGLGMVLAFALIFGVGILVSARISQLLLGSAESLVERIPIVKTIYVSLRDIAALMSGDSKKGLGQVVAVKIQDMRLIGFVTTEDPKSLPVENGEKLVGVYLPMSYGIGGYTVYLPKAHIQPLDMSLEDGMRITMSGGVSPATSAIKTTETPGERAV